MNLLEKIRKLVQEKNYALRPHTVSHMLAEGFDEGNIAEAVGNGKILEHYTEEDRCLIAGTFRISENTEESLHIVADFWSESEDTEWIDIVTAYIPRRPFWETPYMRGRRKK